MKRCKNCQKEIDRKAKKCPYCQTDQRNWFLKHKIISTIIAIFILVGISGSSTENKNTKNSQTTSSNRPTQVPSITPSDHEIQADVRFNEQAFLIENKEEVSLKQCRLGMNSSGLFNEGYIYNLAQIPVNDSVLVPFNEFTKKDGTRFNPYATKAQSLSLSCKDVGGKSGFNYFTL